MSISQRKYRYDLNLLNNQHFDNVASIKLVGSYSGYSYFQASSSGNTIIYTLPPTAGQIGYILSTDGTGILNWVSGSTNVVTLAGLIDVNLNSPLDGQILTYSGGTNKWVNLPINYLPSSAYTLSLYNLSTGYTNIQVNSAVSYITNIGYLIGNNNNFLSANTNGNWLSANTSYYTQLQSNANFLSANTNYEVKNSLNYLSANTIYVANNNASSAYTLSSYNLSTGYTDIKVNSSITYITNIGYLIGSNNNFLSANTSGNWLSANTSYYTQTQTNNNFLSANTSYYTQTQTNSNFVSALTFNTSKNWLSANTSGNWLSANTSANFLSAYTYTQSNSNFLSANTNYEIKNSLNYLSANTSGNWLSANTIYVANNNASSAYTYSVYQLSTGYTNIKLISYYNSAQTNSNFLSANTFLDYAKHSEVSSAVTYVTSIGYLTGDTNYVHTTGNEIIQGNKTFLGNIVVSGTTTYLNSQNLNVINNYITINSGETGSGVTAGFAGLVIKRGTSPDYEIQWNEITQNFRVGQTGQTVALAGREDNPINGYIAVWNSALTMFVTTTSIASITNSNSAYTLSLYNQSTGYTDIKVNSAVSYITNIGYLIGNNSNFLSANTSFYTQQQANNNFLSANTVYIANNNASSAYTLSIYNLSTGYTNIQVNSAISYITNIGYLIGNNSNFLSANTIYVANNNSSSAYTLLMYNLSTGYTDSQLQSYVTTGTSQTISSFKSFISGVTFNKGITGLRNEFIGIDSGSKNISGNDNIAIGYQSSYSIITGNSSIAIGYQSLYNNVIGSTMVAIGYQAAYNLVSGDTVNGSLVAIGYKAGYGITGTVSNGRGVYIGYTAGGTGNNSESVSIGYSAGGGASNAFLGNFAGNGNNSSNNVAVGFQALGGSYLTGSYNTALGYVAGYAISTGTENVFIGEWSARYNTTGSKNVYLGGYSGYLNITGTSNVFLGYQAGYNETTNNKLYINNDNGDQYDSLIYGEFDNRIVRVNGQLQLSGNVSKLYSSNNILYFSDSQGTYSLLQLSLTGNSVDLSPYYTSAQTNSNFLSANTTYVANNNASSAYTLSIYNLSTGYTNIQVNSAISYLQGSTTITTGNLVESGSNVLLITGGTGAVVGSGVTIQMKPASATTSGYLSSDDYNSIYNQINIIKSLALFGIIN